MSAARHCTGRGRSIQQPIGDSQVLVSCGHSLTMSTSPSSIRTRTAGSAPAAGRRNLGQRAQHHPRLLAQPGRHGGDLSCEHRRTSRACNWLRTGDLGFLDESGELFITGRIKDLIIIRGMNHYPQDIERTVQDSHPALRRDCGAAFAITDEDGDEKLAVVQEVERTHRRNLDVDAIAGHIREAVTRQHEIADPGDCLDPPATLPKTTSGKIQRSLAQATVA